MDVKYQKKKQSLINQMIKLEIKHYLNQLNIFIIEKKLSDANGTKKNYNKGN